MRKTPKSLRLQIGIFGRTNVGKSSFLNLVTAQNVAITSSVPGTTTDVVEKAMELLPLGPVMFLDTGGVDDVSELALLRIKKTRAVFNRADINLLITEDDLWSEYEEGILAESSERNTPVIVVINKTDIKMPSERFIESIRKKVKHIIVCSSVDHKNRDRYVNLLKQFLFEVCPEYFLKPTPLVGDLLPKRGLAVFVVPIDLEAPRGRIILPQVQAIRDILDHNLMAIIVKETEFKGMLTKLRSLPDIVVCDSQAVFYTVENTPLPVKCTSFSILFSRFKGGLIEEVKGVAAIHRLHPGNEILIAEACSHHPIEGDIGRQKIPALLQKYVGGDLKIDVCQGRDYPDNLERYKLVVHCGGCMLTRREMLFRINQAIQQGVAITNYGVCISFLLGVLERVLSPFPDAISVYKELTGCVERMK